MLHSQNHQPRWREYQAQLQRTDRIKRLKRRLPILFLVLCIASGGIFLLFHEGAKRHSPAVSILKPEKGTSDDAKSPDMTQQNLASILGRVMQNSSVTEKQYVVENDGRLYRITTTIQTKLQKHTERLLRHSRTLQAAVVVLDPSDGRILAMAGRDTNGGSDNICLKADYPAASLFKIVSAAAALEGAGFTPDKPLHFNGRRHTLYKSQLKQSKNRYSMRTSFRKAFAISNNSIFGKIGIYDLGQEMISVYANRFFFNRPIPFDLPLDISVITVPEDEYGLAEIASGFNKTTLMSPLHAAMVSSAVANHGNMTAPWLVSAVLDESDRVLYRGRPMLLYSPIGQKASDQLRLLMKDTVRYGTSRTALGRLRRYKRFKGFELGAKTGTINDPQDRYKYDWLTAFVIPPEGDNPICISTLSVHGRLLGTRATEMARAIIHYYYSTY